MREAGEIALRTRPRRDDIDTPDAATERAVRGVGSAALERQRRAAAAAPPIAAVRWGAVAVGLALMGTDSEAHGLRFAVSALVLVAYTIFRTVRPLDYNEDVRDAVPVLAEVALSVAVVVRTGYWESPFVFALITAVMVAGYAGGFLAAIQVGLLSAAAVATPFALASDTVSSGWRASAQWTAVLIMVAVIAGYARRITTESARQHSLALDRLGRLAEANALLFSLHRVAQTLPNSLDLDEVLQSTMSRLRDLLDFDAGALLLFDETDSRWVPARREGMRLETSLRTEDLPMPLQWATRSEAAVAVPDLSERGPGLGSSTGSGIYAPLRARGGLIGLLALEHPEPRHFAPRHLEMLNGLLESVALALDNARWFARLRTIGADEERLRIARDLHDRIAQSLAYLGFELDRVTRAASRGDDVSESLGTLREDVRGVIREVRDTLYDLRTEVSETQSFTDTMAGFLERVRGRSNLDVAFVSDDAMRLPLAQERELWRIAKEAVTNVERHARASRLEVRWRCRPEQTELVVADDGVGFVGGTPTRLDSYGIVGMRERAASIGARLEITSPPSGGTCVRVQLDPTLMPAALRAGDAEEMP